MPSRPSRLGLSLLAAAALSLAADHPAEPQISAASLRGHLSFLASDLLEGRGTPSRGLDLAAEYIAAQFRRANLEPGGDDGYFQTAPYLSLQPNPDGLHFALSGQPPIPLASALIENSAEVSITDADAVKIGGPGSVAGKVVFMHAARLRDVYSARRELAAAKPALLVVTGAAAASLSTHGTLAPADAREPSIPLLAIPDAALAARIDSAPAGPLPFQVTAHIAAPIAKPVALRNVIGILRGSDPILKDTCELVTAHYDHLGMKGGRIFNGANDDASGTVSVIEIAAALAAMNPHPRRSILFVAFFGEELGLLGSRYYGQHPVFPLAQTIAEVNLEHMGRTDSNLGPHIGMVNFTGFDFSDLPSIFKSAGTLTGIAVVKDEANSDAYFARSDNQALADLGVPAHTVSVSYEFPEYHQVGDEWMKIDYDNMARVDRMIALGLLTIANSDTVPHWSETNPKAAKYREAWKKLHPAN